MIPRRSAYLCIALAAALLSSCAALTSSQVGEVQKFAAASEEYSALPGSLAQSYGILLRNNKLLSLSRYEYGTDTGSGIDTTKANQAWDTITGAYALEQGFDAAGRRMDAALKVLKDYSSLLTLLVSDQYSDALGQSAVDLGKAIDGATDAYNKQFRAANPLSKVGGDVGQAVRAAGGVYLKHRQAVILKETIGIADPLIQGLMAEVKDVALNSFKPDFLNYESNFLAPTFESVANNNHRVAPSTVSAVYDDLVRTRAGVALCDEIASGAQAYATAHHALLEQTRSRLELKEAIGEIQALGREVSAAKKTKAAIGK
jgi:hypothetical protein